MTTINLQYGVLTNEHPSSSDGQPVLVYEGVAHGPADMMDLGIFGLEPAYEHSRRAVVPGTGLDADQVALMDKWIARKPAALNPPATLGFGMYINHITLSIGHTRRSPRAEVADATIKALSPWLAAALAHVDDYPLPGPPGRAGFVAGVSIQHGALLCHLGQLQAGPLVTFGVAARSRQSHELWAWMCAQYGSVLESTRFGSVDARTAPETPWCAVALHPAFGRQHGMSAWVGEFERCVAWTWLDKK